MLRRKNTLKLNSDRYGDSEYFYDKVLENSKMLPDPINYDDIDKAFIEWVDKELSISFEGERLSTITLLSNQRFTEYMQSWDNVDDKRNLKMNFKTVSRELNPKSGTINGDSKNIPGDRFYLMKRVLSVDDNGRKYFTDYMMKQPMAVDMIYTVTIATNKIDLINKFNNIVSEKFKAITNYIVVNEHYISSNLEDVSDESVYSIDDRQYYYQSFKIKLKAYIITEDYFKIEEKPYIKFIGFEGDTAKGSVDIEEYPCEEPVNDFYYKPIILTIIVNPCESNSKFTIDTEFTIKNIEIENIRNFKIKVSNGDELSVYEDNYNNVSGYTFHNGEMINICKINKYRENEPSKIVFNGYDMTTVYNHNEDETEFLEDNKNIEEEIFIKK